MPKSFTKLLQFAIHFRTERIGRTGGLFEAIAGAGEAPRNDPGPIGARAAPRCDSSNQLKWKATVGEGAQDTGTYGGTKGTIRFAGEPAVCSNPHSAAALRAEPIGVPGFRVRAAREAFETNPEPLVAGICGNSESGRFPAAMVKHDRNAVFQAQAKCVLRPLDSSPGDNSADARQRIAAAGTAFSANQQRWAVGEDHSTVAPLDIERAAHGTTPSAH